MTRLIKRLISILLLIPDLSPAQKILINEFLALNNTTNRDNFGQYEDWIELYNPNSFSTSLSGYRLTDDPTNPNKWIFPDNIMIPAKGYLLVWASNQRYSYNQSHSYKFQT